MLGGTDGAQWIVERAKNGRYRMVRWSPEQNEAFVAACDVFLDLAGRDIVEGPIY
jgi:hypothetical protein